MAKAPAPAQKPPAQPKGGAAKGQPRKRDGAPTSAPAAKTKPKGTGEVPARLKERFQSTVVAASSRSADTRTPGRRRGYTRS